MFSVYFPEMPYNGDCFNWMKYNFDQTTKLDWKCLMQDMFP